MARDVMIFIVCGLLFMGSAAFTIVQAQFAERSAARLAWFVATGCVLFLFAYWALTVVFRPPDMKETVGCGGVKFVNGPLGGPGVEGEGPGEMRTEL